MTELPVDEPDETRADRVRALHDHLVATAELPIDRETNRWLGEAEAVARDVATNELDPETTTMRVQQVQHLLAEADEPDHDEATAHLTAARELCAELLS